MQNKTLSQRSQSTQLLNCAGGMIDPLVRVRSNEITDQEISRLVRWLYSDEAYENIETSYVPVQCIDGRKSDRKTSGFNAAGGTFSLVMGDALTHESYRHKNETAPEHAKRLYTELIKMGYSIGGHIDEYANADNCGCGALDRLDSSASEKPSILRYLAHRGSEIRALIDEAGFTVSDALHEQIISTSARLRREKYATKGPDLRRIYVETAGEQSIAIYKGKHNEVALVINRQTETTLDRSALYAEFGTLYQVFNIDVSALQKASGYISLSPTEAYEKFIAALYYNLATVSVLAGPSLRVIFR